MCKNNIVIRRNFYIRRAILTRTNLKKGLIEKKTHYYYNRFLFIHEIVFP
jgi:hypothetical protein